MLAMKNSALDRKHDPKGMTTDCPDLVRWAVLGEAACSEAATHIRKDDG